MNKIAGRAGITMIIAMALLVGFGFFLMEYFTQADEWSVFPGSPHVYNGSNIGCGITTDRDGVLLLDLSGNRTYSADEMLRKSTVHWLGDRKGSVSAPALSHYSAELAGYDLVSGLYSYGGTGGTAKLTLSAKVQATALEAMGKYRGTVAVYNYKTGELICAVTTPNYDPDHPPQIDENDPGEYEGLYVNRFTQSVYIPGSIFKIVTLAAALEHIKDVEQMAFSCEGTYAIGSDLITCEKSHGKQSLKEAFCNSCNCAFAQVVQKLGKENLQRYVEQFGVTQPVTFDGITTATGTFEGGSASNYSAAWSGIGQYTDEVNPCAFLKFVGAIAAGGKGVSPYLVSSISADGIKSYSAKTVKGERILSEATADRVCSYMRNNVQTKYGDENFPGLTVCAKTGTGEVGGNKKPNAMLAGFVEDEQMPLAFIVAIEDAGYGAKVCIPIISKVLGACKDMIG